MMNSCVPDFDPCEKDIGFILDPADHHGLYNGKPVEASSLHNGKPVEATSDLKTDNSFVPDDAFEELCWEDGQLLVVMQGSKGNICNSGTKVKCGISNHERFVESPSVNVNTISPPSVSGGDYVDGCLNGQQDDELLLWLQDSWGDVQNERGCFPGGGDGGTRTWTDFSQPSSPMDLPHGDTSLRSTPRTHSEQFPQENTCDQHNPSHKHYKFGVVPSIMVPPPPRSRNLQQMSADSPVAAVPSSPPPSMSNSRHFTTLNQSKIDPRFAVVPSLKNGAITGDDHAGLQFKTDPMCKGVRLCESIPGQAKRLLYADLGHESVSSRKGDEESVVSTHETAACANLESSTIVGTSCTVTEGSYDLANTMSLDVSESCGPSKNESDVFLETKMSHQASVTLSLDASQSCRDVTSATGLKRKLSDVADSEHQSSQDPNSRLTNGSSPSTTTRRNSRSSENHNQLERRRRNKIREKMKALQDLIPNSNKTDKASMLDEAIAYMKLLQQKVQTMAVRSGMEISPTLLPQGMQHLQVAATLPQTNINQHLQIAAAFPQTNINAQQLHLAALQQTNLNNLAMSMNLGMMDMNGSIMSQAIYASALPQMQRLLIPALAAASSVAQSPYPAAAASPFSGVIRPGMPVHAYPMLVPVMMPPPASTTLKEGAESIRVNGSQLKPSNA